MRDLPSTFFFPTILSLSYLRSRTRGTLADAILHLRLLPLDLFFFSSFPFICHDRNMLIGLRSGFPRVAFGVSALQYSGTLDRSRMSLLFFACAQVPCKCYANRNEFVSFIGHGNRDSQDVYIYFIRRTRCETRKFGFSSPTVYRASRRNNNRSIFNTRTARICVSLNRVIHTHR